jgi:hypothetical protein
MADSMEIMLLSFLTLVLQNEWDWEGDHPIEIPIITDIILVKYLCFIPHTVERNTNLKGDSIGDRTQTY